PLLGSNVRFDGFVPLLQKAGLPLIRFHDLRHTAATFLLLQGVHPKVVSEMLGHASVGITLDLYSHVLPNMQKEATEALDRLLVGKHDRWGLRAGWFHRRFQSRSTGLAPTG